ncbi:MAG: HDOD domain-containing protein [Fibrobacter sp.]|nr:HDOD domain-containing protein [Fibrobacter sp.]
MDKETMLAKLDGIENLPTLPVMVQQIQKLINSPNSSMNQIGALISKDQAIAARVVRLVNSAFYGLGRKVSSIPQAIVVLGLNTVKNLVTGVSVIRMFETTDKASIFNRDMFWLHSLGCAMGARLIAKSMGRSEPEDYFLAGLLHDIGVLILDQFFHDEFISVLKHANDATIEYHTAEQKVLGLTHCEVGAIVAEKWKIPDFLIQTMRYHHTSINENPEINCDIINIVHIADVAATNTGLHMGFNEEKKNYFEYALAATGIKQSAIDDAFGVVEKEIKVLKAEWGL